jgi:hypothetical protein
MKIHFYWLTPKCGRLSDVKKCICTCLTHFGVKIGPQIAFDPKVRCYNAYVYNNVIFEKLLLWQLNNRLRCLYFLIFKRLLLIERVNHYLNGRQIFYFLFDSFVSFFNIWINNIHHTRIRCSRQIYLSIPIVLNVSVIVVIVVHLLFYACRHFSVWQWFVITNIDFKQAFLL